MEKKLIITIGRQFGSGGYDVGKLLAEKLGIDFYDKELIGRAAKESGINPELFARADEQPTNSFLYSLSLGTVGLHTGFMATPDYLTNDKLFALQSETLRSIAQEHSCVIIGRCADYVLRDHPNMVSVFIHSDIERRVARVSQCAEMNAEQARQAIKKTDRRRASYYSYFTDRNWGGVDNYDLSIDSGRVGIEGAVEVIAKFLEVTR